MNIAEEKQKLENRLAELEQYMHELDRMASETFSNRKRQYEEEIEEFTKLFINVGTIIGDIRNEMLHNLGIDGKTMSPQVLSEDELTDEPVTMIHAPRSHGKSRAKLS